MKAFPIPATENVRVVIFALVNATFPESVLTVFVRILRFPESVPIVPERAF